MIRLLFTIIAGVLLGGVVHLVSVLALPRIATQDAYSRLTPITRLNAVTVLPPADPSNTLMPYLDPAFATAVCRYDLSDGPIKLSVQEKETVNVPLWAGIGAIVAGVVMLVLPKK